MIADFHFLRKSTRGFLDNISHIYVLHTFCCVQAQSFNIVDSCHLIRSLQFNLVMSRYGVLGGGCDIFVLQRGKGRHLMLNAKQT